ncbi:ABC transporter substrate-binding protein [Pelomonas sp. KK5]|uniref:substrate-binding periplasmic protein n=1 Tax=Pelomonas sp. KK5 TaxID=1855730 RepID=UPI00130201C9|nr:transporter substrate-binding domain-containing protein [Pelomonas sp. KK5]
MSAIFSRIARRAGSVLCGVALAFAAQAQQQQQQPVRSYTIGVEDADQRPLFYVDGKGQYSGYIRDLLDAFARAQGVRFTYVPLPIKRLYQSFLKDQTLDFKFPDNPLWRPAERAGLPLSYSAALHELTAGLLVLREHQGAPLETVQRLGTLRGFTPWLYQRQIDAGAMNVFENTSMDKLVGQLRLHRLDALYLNVDLALPLVERLGLAGEVVYDPGLPHAPLLFQVSTLKHPELLKALDAFLRNEILLQAALRQRHQLLTTRVH